LFTQVAVAATIIQTAHDTGRSEKYLGSKNYQNYCTEKGKLVNNDARENLQPQLHGAACIHQHLAYVSIQSWD